MPRAIGTLFILIAGGAVAVLIGTTLNWIAQAVQGTLSPGTTIPSHWLYLAIGLLIGLVGAAAWEFVRLGHLRQVLAWLKGLTDKFLLAAIAGVLIWIILYL